MDDGRLLVLLATLGVAGASVARGSRGVVRKARVPVAPSERLINFLGGHEWNYFAGPWTVQWKWEGEGVSGDYDKGDPDDFPLLRATVLRSDDDAFSASFCTLADARKATAVILGAFSEQLLSEAVDFEKDSFSRKKMGVWTNSTEIV
jgi:hypothetical protein